MRTIRAGDAGDDLREQLQLFPDDFGGDEGGRPRDVSPWPRQAGHEPIPHRIHQKTDPKDSPRLLRASRERRGEEPGSDNADERAAVHYSMTRSARSSSDGGIARPSAFAVFRLITSSNLVGCSMGRSPGFVPLRIRST